MPPLWQEESFEVWQAYLNDLDSNVEALSKPRLLELDRSGLATLLACVGQMS